MRPPRPPWAPTGWAPNTSARWSSVDVPAPVLIVLRAQGPKAQVCEQDDQCRHAEADAGRREGAARALLALDERQHHRAGTSACCGREPRSAPLRPTDMRVPAAVLLTCLMLSSCGESEASLSSGRTAASPSAATSPEVRPASKGDVAVWVVDVEQQPQASDTEVKALVQRLGCASGETGEVLPPEVVEQEDEVIVGFTVGTLPLADFYACPGNKQVAYTVPLSAPLGQRKLIDAACRAGEASTTSHCIAGAERWPSPR